MNGSIKLVVKTPETDKYAPEEYFLRGKRNYFDGIPDTHKGEPWEADPERQEYSLGYSFGAPHWGQEFDRVIHAGP